MANCVACFQAVPEARIVYLEATRERGEGFLQRGQGASQSGEGKGGGRNSEWGERINSQRELDPGLEK